MRAPRPVLTIVLTIALLTAPLAAEAQQAKIPRLGVLLLGTPDTDAFPAIRRGLSAPGYVEGRNIVFEHRYAEGRSERLPDLTSDLARSKPDLICALGRPYDWGHPGTSLLGGVVAVIRLLP